MNATKIHIYITALAVPQTIFFFLENTHFALPPSYPISRGFFPVWFLAWFIKQANYANVSDDANDYVKVKNHTGRNLCQRGSPKQQGHPATFFFKITVQRRKYRLAISKAWEKLKMSAQPFHSSKIFGGFPLDWLLFSEVVSFTF